MCWGARGLMAASLFYIGERVVAKPLGERLHHGGNPSHSKRV